MSLRLRYSPLEDAGIESHVSPFVGLPTVDRARPEGNHGAGRYVAHHGRLGGAGAHLPHEHLVAAHDNVDVDRLIQAVHHAQRDRCLTGLRRWIRHLHLPASTGSEQQQSGQHRESSHRLVHVRS